MEFEFLPVFRSMNRPGAEQRGSSGNKSRKRFRWPLNLLTGMLDSELMQLGRQFQRSLAVCANEVWRCIVAGL